METKQTAVQWLQDKLFELEIKIDPSIAKETFFLFAEAKIIEKEQIKDAHLIGLITSMEMEATKQAEQYYNETYNKQDK